MSQFPATDDTSSQQLTMVLKEYGLITAEQGMNILTGFQRYQDTIHDLKTFKTNAKRYHEIKTILTNIDEMKEPINTGIANEISRNWFNEKLDFLSGGDPISGTSISNKSTDCSELGGKFDKLQKEFKELHKTYGDPKMIQKKADALLNNGNTIKVLQLLTTFIQLGVGIGELQQNGCKLNYVKKNLNEIEQKYVNPTIHAMRNQQEINVKLIERGLMEMGIFANIIEDFKSTVKNSTISHATSAVFNGVQCASTITQMMSLSGIASKTVMIGQGIIAAFQGTASVGHTCCAIWGTYNYFQWKQLAKTLNEWQISLNKCKKIG